jgi:formylglycine-generating enzyme required for sulfatase activity
MKRIFFPPAALPMLLWVFFSAASCSKPMPDNMVLIRGGSYIMGSPETDPDYVYWEGPRHGVTVHSFYMGKFEVSQREYFNVTGNNPSHEKNGKAPVDTVSWYNAVEYCNILSQREGLSPAYEISGETVRWNRKAKGYRLPTEAEWEYACRGGTVGPYYTGNTISPDQACFGAHVAFPSGTFEPNPFGLYDMSGNVYEWCWDWYGDYPAGTQSNPEGPPEGTLRVIRGGSAGSDAQHLRSAERGRTEPSTRNVYLGFRLVRDTN